MSGESLRQAPGTFFLFHDGSPKGHETAGRDRRFEDDVRDEGMDPDVQIKIKGLNEAKIKAWWNDFKKNNKWESLGQNCAWVTINALIRGADKLPQDYWRAYAMPHTPNDAERFAKMVQGISKCKCP